MGCMSGSGASFWKSLLSFHHVGLRDGTQAIRLGRKPLPSHLTSPHFSFYRVFQLGHLCGGRAKGLMNK